MTMALNKNADDDDDDADDRGYDDIVIPDNSLRHDPLEFLLKTCYTQTGYWLPGSAGLGKSRQVGGDGKS